MAMVSEAISKSWSLCYHLMFSCPSGINKVITKGNAQGFLRVSELRSYQWLHVCSAVVSARTGVLYKVWQIMLGFLSLCYATNAHLYHKLIC